MALSLRDHLADAGVQKWIAMLSVVNATLPVRNVREALRFFDQYMPHLPVEMALNFLRATDLSKPVHAITLAAGETLIAYRSATESQFKLFFTRPGRAVTSSGLNPEGRGFVRFVVQRPVPALESYAAAALDTWTRIGRHQKTTVAPRHDTTGVMAAGGALQLIIPESYAHVIVTQA